LVFLFLGLYERSSKSKRFSEEALTALGPALVSRDGPEGRPVSITSQNSSITSERLQDQTRPANRGRRHIKAKKNGGAVGQDNAANRTVGNSLTHYRYAT
jgi:hypothetical protein